MKRKQPIVICSHVFSRSYKHLHGLFLLCIVNGWFCCLVLLWLANAVTKDVADKNVFEILCYDTHLQVILVLYNYRWVLSISALACT